MRRLCYALLAGSASGLLTAAEFWGLNHSSIRVPLWLFNLAAILLLPGFLAGYIANGNVHVANPWVATVVNFAFYFGLTWLVLKAWEKFRTRGERLTKA